MSPGPSRAPRETAPVGVVVHPDAELLAHAAAARLSVLLLDAQAQRGGAAVVLTGGGVGTAVLRSLAASPARDAVDWRRVDLWWGDERFLPPGDPERNETSARAALLDRLPLDPTRVHPMPADAPAGSRGAGGDPEAAAARYAEELAAAADGTPGSVPAFDVLLLGVGPDGHVASLFPGRRTPAEGSSVVAVRDAPKPPPTRLSLTMPALCSAREVWLLAAGAEKADAVRTASSVTAGGDGDRSAEAPPAGLVRGRGRTLWLVDRDAARGLPTA